jgi:hypothetical protein
MKTIIVENGGKETEITPEKLTEMKSDYKIKLTLDKDKSNEELNVYIRKDLLVETTSEDISKN